MRELFVWLGGVLACALSGLLVVTIVSIDMGIHEEYAGAAMWNEQMSHEVISTSAEKISPSLDGKAVFLQGRLEVSEPVEDPVLGYSTEAARLTRRVEYFNEWREKTTKSVPGGGVRETTRTIRDWTVRQPDGVRKDVVDLDPLTRFPDQVKLGAFILSQQLLEPILEPEFVPLSEWFTPSLFPSVEVHTVDSHYLHFGEDPDDPAIGDVRLSLSRVPLGEVSVVAWQKQRRLVPAPHREEPGLDSFWIVRGKEEPEQMLSLRSLLFGDVTYLAFHLFFPPFLALPWSFLLAVLRWMQSRLHWEQARLRKVLEWNSSYRVLLVPFFLHFVAGGAAAWGVDLRLVAGNLALALLVLILARRPSAS